MSERMGTILFDLDGTLTDNYQGIARSIAHALDALGNGVGDRCEGVECGR